ncbi:hypothetical protein HMPREF9439_00121 [Parasutterella excrementihominis YIT 11859]|uniref:Uncharacterized protein n=1 Tax=Parasutterella excrementihominis YIT 11859 TaxID=762966 RepID=F3QGT2_9BURK|nr:hypothetical protein HMPREF9439_00121 [Parasutterella excrementihominis YIT 11859]
MLFDFDLVLGIPANKYSPMGGETGGLKKNPKASGASSNIVFSSWHYYSFSAVNYSSAKHGCKGSLVAC